MKNHLIKLTTNGVVESGDRKYTRLVGGFGEDKPMFLLWQCGDLLNLRTAKVL